jgi:trans-AT polyketide synthase/acyltransferase/oxidoreductase domain-containing protein
MRLNAKPPEEGRDMQDLSREITPQSLGSPVFKTNYGIKYAYLCGAMYKAIASQQLVVNLARAGLMGYFGTGGLSLREIETAIQAIQSELTAGQAYGMNLLCDLERPDLEDGTVDLYCRHGIQFIEAAAYVVITPSLVRYRLKGLSVDPKGNVTCSNRIMAKVSRPEVASLFMQPPPERVVKSLLAAGLVSATQAQLASRIPLSSEICVEADSGGHTDRGVASALFPAILALRAEMMAKYRYERPIQVGAAGGIGTPQAAAAAFVMGADFVLTGSINQCTVEAGTSNAVKDLLQDINVQDTAHAPAGDMFELGAKIQVLKRGSFFAARANKLYELYQRYNCLEDIEAETRIQIETKFFHRSFEEVWNEVIAYHSQTNPGKAEKIKASPKRRMAAVFKWYFFHTTQLALAGSAEQSSDYQVHCGPALGAFNQWVKGTELESWHRRRVADIAERIMYGTARLLSDRLRSFTEQSSSKWNHQRNDSQDDGIVGKTGDISELWGPAVASQSLANPK